MQIKPVKPVEIKELIVTGEKKVVPTGVGRYLRIGQRALDDYYPRSCRMSGPALQDWQLPAFSIYFQPVNSLMAGRRQNIMQSNCRDSCFSQAVPFASVVVGDSLRGRGKTSKLEKCEILRVGRDACLDHSVARSHAP